MFNIREEAILNLMNNLLAQFTDIYKQKTILDDVTIDASFLLRFDQICIQQLHNIRQKMHLLFDQSSNEPLAQHEGWRLYIHLNNHLGLRISNQISAKHQLWHFFLPHKRGYVSLNINDNINWITINEQEMLIDTHRRSIVKEALLTVQIMDDMNQLAYRFGLLPRKKEIHQYPLDELKRRWQHFVQWVIFDKPLPIFYRPMTVLIEIPSDGVKKSILACSPLPHMARQLDQKRKPPLALATRIRTWSIYYLTRRGGGSWTEEQACAFLETHEQVYRKQRYKLFSSGTKKRIL